jgi:hypothetical protein
MSAGLLRSRHRWQPQQSQVCHGSVMDLGLDRTPKCTGPRSGPLRVRIEARQRWMASTRVSCTWLVRKILRNGRHVGLDFYDLLIEALIEGF